MTHPAAHQGAMTDRTMRDALASVARVVFASGYPGNRAHLAGVLGASTHGEVFAQPQIQAAPAQQGQPVSANDVLDSLDFLDG